MQAIHFICKREDGVNLKGLKFDKERKTFRSGDWDISVEDAQSLVGGWLYLHPDKASPSEFGGTVLGFETVVNTTKARSERIILVVQKQQQAIRQRWRGKDHSMAHSSGVVDADLPHEKG